MKKIFSLFLLLAICILTVNANVNKAVTGPTIVCAGSTIQLSDATLSGGTWTSSNKNIATVTSAGLVKGVASGTVTITHSATGYTSTINITVNALPAVAAISGTSSVCKNSSVKLSDATPKGVWNSSNPNKATIDSNGNVVGIGSSNSVTISYTIKDSTTGCYNVANLTNFTVYDLPTYTSIKGTSTICANASTTLTDGTSGGVWSSSNTAAATVNASTGVVSGVAGGSTTITYTYSDAHCSNSATLGMTINPLLDATITGSNNVCKGSTTNLTAATAGGVWSSSNTAVATINSSGVVTGVAAGVASISYAATSGCGTSTKTLNFTVNDLPTINITGPTSLFKGEFSNLTGMPSGGNWNSSNPSVITIDGTGYINGFANGTSTISYNYLDNTTGCSNIVTTTINCVEYCSTVSNVPDFLQQNGNSSNAVQPCSGYIINVFFHAIEDANGTYSTGYNGVPGRTFNQDVQIAMNDLQNGFSPLNISFVLVGQDEIKDHNIYSSDFFPLPSNGSGNFTNFQSMGKYTPNAIDIYLYPMGSYQGNLGGGYSANIISKALALGIQNGVSFSEDWIHDICHEMGHCLGLYHTFHGTGGCSSYPGGPTEGGISELVDGTNGTTAGDYVKDTYADPAGGSKHDYFDPNTCIWKNTLATSCSITGIVDANYQNYCPDGTNFMCYSNIGCRNHFTNGQGDRIKNCIALSNVIQQAVVISTILTGNIINAYPIRKGVYPPIKNAISQLTDLNKSSNNLITTNTNYTGHYQFPTITTTGSVNFSLTPFKNPNFKTTIPHYDVSVPNSISGITSTDLALIQSHILGRTLLNSPFKMLAADVDGNGKITLADIVNIKRVVLGMDLTFYGKDNNFNTIDRGLFGFITQPSSNSLNSTNPFTIWQFPNYITPNFRLTSFANNCNQPSNDFYGFKLGDVNWDWNPLYQRTANNTITPVTLFYDDVNVTNSNNINVPIKVNNFSNLIGMQFTLNFNTNDLAFVSLTNVITGLDYNITQGDFGKLSFLWTDSTTEGVSLTDNSTLFELNFTKKSGLVKTDIILNNNITPIQVIDKNIQYIPLEKNGGNIYSSTLSVNNETGNWKIISPYSIEGTVFIQVNALQNQNITLQLFDKSNNLLLEMPESVHQGTNTIYANFRSKINLEAGNYNIVLKGISNDMSQSFVIGSDRQEDPIEDIAAVNIAIGTNDTGSTTFVLQTQLYYRLINDPSINNILPILDPNPRLCDVPLLTASQKFLANNKYTNINIIYTIDLAITNGYYDQARNLLSTWQPANEVESNYYQYFQWVIKVVTGTSLTDIELTSLNNLILSCPLTAGMVVYSSRDLFNYINNTHIVFEDACGVDNYIGSKKVKPTTNKNSPIVCVASDKHYTINVYPNPCSGILNIELPTNQKGNWKITLNDVYGKTIQEIFASESSSNETINIKEASGLYFLNILNLSSGKYEIRKIILK